MEPLVPAMVFLATLTATVASSHPSGWWAVNGSTGGDGHRVVYLMVGYGEAGTAGPVGSEARTGCTGEDRNHGGWTGVRLRAENQEGNIIGSHRHGSAAQPVAAWPNQRLQPPPNEDCAGFDPTTAAVRQMGKRWQIVVGEHWLFDFGTDRSAADGALSIIRHYRLNRACFVGRPDPSFVYLLARGGVPSGAMPGEDCLRFDPGSLRLSRINHRWTIIDGGRRLVVLGSNASEARRALAAIRQHGFTHICFAGRPRAAFTYLRR